MSRLSTVATRAAVAAVAGALWSSASFAEPLALIDPAARSNSIFDEMLRDRAPAVREAAPDAAEVPARLRRQLVDYPTHEAPGTIVIDTPHTYLYYVVGGGKAVRYGIGVGREGFTWAGTETVARKAEWPDWIPPAEMLKRQPYLPRFMAGGLGNPLGARAIYLGNTAYRIHGTNAPQTIGGHVSSGCIRMLNQDVVDLYERVQVGTKVVVLPGGRQEPNVARIKPAAVVPVSASIAPAAPSYAASGRVRAFGLY